MAGAAVTVERIGESDTDGKFELKKIPDGHCRILLRHAGHASRILESLQITSQMLKTFTVYLAPAVHAEVIVLDTSDKPVADVGVRAVSVIGFDGRGYAPAGDANAVTDAAGHAMFEDLPQGSAQIFASAKNYHQVDMLKLYALPSKGALQVRITTTGALHGSVKLPAGQSAANVDVSVVPEGGEMIGKWSGSMRVKADGTFQFDQVTPGKYRVSANPRMMMDGDDPNAVAVTIEAGKSAEVQVPATAGGEPSETRSTGSAKTA